MFTRPAAIEGEATRSLPAQTYGMVALGALYALGVECCVGFSLGFAPGWANGWPGGLSIYRVWSGVMTGIVVAIELTVGFGLGALTSFLLCRFPPGRRYAGFVFGVWLVACTGLTVLACSWMYRGIYASTLEMWPDGYPGGGS
jgi:hypothetical protein